jgi:hypothetical protein
MDKAKKPNPSFIFSVPFCGTIKCANMDCEKVKKNTTDISNLNIPNDQWMFGLAMNLTMRSRK